MPLTPFLGAKLVYLPPYSPDMNPIEETFSFMKAWLRRHEKDAINPQVRPWLIHRALLAVTIEELKGGLVIAGTCRLE
jgi:transposase